MDAVSQTVEIIKAVAELLKPISWPCAVFASVWITRHQLRALIKRISKLRIGHKDTTADIEIAPELAAAAEAVTLARTVMLSGKAEGKATITADFTVTNLQKEKAIALRATMGNDLGNLETLAAIAEKVPRATIEQSWEILKKNIGETAKLYGFRRSEEGGSDLHQAVHYLTRYVLKSQSVMIGVYALATALQKVEKNQDGEVSAKDAQNFARYCMAIIADLSFQLIEPESSGPS